LGIAVSDPGDSFERAAESTASQLMSAGARSPVAAAAGPQPAPQRGAGLPVVQRALPVAAEVLEIALTVAITVQKQSCAAQCSSCV
jgi:hypothetical protein